MIGLFDDCVHLHATKSMALKEEEDIMEYWDSLTEFGFCGLALLTIFYLIIVLMGFKSFSG